MVLDQQQARWKERVRQAEREKQELYLRGVRSTDERVKVDCARRVFQMDTNVKHYDAMVAQLEVQKNNSLALVRAMEAREMAADVAEIQQGEREIERLTQEYQLSQHRLEEARGTIRVVEGGRLEAAPEEAPEVQSILQTMRVPAGVVSTFLSKAELEFVTGTLVDLEGGIAFDSSGNFYLAEANSDSILRFDAAGTNTVWVSAASIQAVTGAPPDLRGGIAFAPAPS